MDRSRWTEHFLKDNIFHLYFSDAIGIISNYMEQLGIDNSVYNENYDEYWYRWLRRWNGEYTMKNTSIRKDILLIGGLLLAGVLLGLILLLTKKPGKSVEIRVSGAGVQSVPLDKPGKYEIEGLIGTNVLVIENGKAHMDEASCPDGICMGMGEIDSNGQSIICLPNEIVVVVVDPEAETKSDSQAVDAVAGGKQ